jgi:methionyl-tRNA synthetase
MLSFAYKRFDGKVPEPDTLDDEDRALLEKVEAGFETVGELYNACKVRAALGEGLALAREANGYTFATLPSALLRAGSAGLDRKAPWFQIKEDPQAAATTVYVILRVVDNLKTILPHTAQQLHEYLGYDGQLFGAQHVVEYEEETRSHAALTYEHNGPQQCARTTLPPPKVLRKPC